MPTQVFRQIRIQEDTPIGQYNDAIYVTDSEFAAMTQDDIDAAVKTRVDNWVQFVAEQSSKEPIPPTVEDLQLQADQLKDQWSRMVAQLAEVGTKDDMQAVADKLAEVVATTDASVEATPIGGKPPVEVGVGEEEAIIP